MEFEHLIKLIETVSASGLTSFQYEEKGMKIKLGKEMQGAAPVISTSISDTAGNQGAATVQAQDTISTASEVSEGSAQTEGKLILSPLVGTFYIAPSEDAEPFVVVGDTVKKGQTLAIVEAMKLMNEIESEFDGVIEEVLAENGQAVEYNQPLFRLR